MRRELPEEKGGRMNTKYVCSLELAKRLKELGVKQESDFYWIERHGKRRQHKLTGTFFLIKMRDLDFRKSMRSYYSAFHVGELGDMLPPTIEVKDIKKEWGYDEVFYRQIHVGINGQWLIYYSRLDDLGDGQMNEIKIHTRYGGKPILEKTEADARAKCLIYLIENKLIDLKEEK